MQRGTYTHMSHEPEASAPDSVECQLASPAERAGIVEPIGMFKAIIESRIARSVIRGLTAYCKRDGTSRLNAALEVYAGFRSGEEICTRCKLALLLTRLVVKLGARSFGASESEVREALKDVQWIRGFSSVVRGLAEFGVQRPFVPAAPFLVVWDITYACNMRCKHCYASAGVRLRDELTTEEAKSVIDTLYRAGVAAIAWSGGEPLLREDLFELSRYAYEKGIYVSMATNATLIDEETARRLWESGMRFLQVSLDSPDPRAHDEFRGVEGSWERATNAVRLASKMGFFVNVSMTASRFNVSDVPRMIDLSEELGAAWFMVYNFVPTGRGKCMIEDDLSPAERLSLLRTLCAELRNPKRRIGVLTTAPQYSMVGLVSESPTGEFVFPTHFANVVGRRLRLLAEFIGGCGCGRYYIAVRPNGDVHPCVFFPLKIGNMLELRDAFEKWWREHEVLNQLRNKDALRENCGKCQFRYVCGGCRARAYAYFDDYMAPDPGCVFNMKAYETCVRALRS